MQAANIYLDAARDLTVISRQNTSSNSSKGFNFPVAIGPNGPTALGAGFSYGAGSRVYTDEPTTLVAYNIFDIYTGNTTYLMARC